MNHNTVINNGLIDKYLLHSLTNKEESELEEHFLFCKECMDTLEKRRQTIGLIRAKLHERVYKQNINSGKNKGTIKFTFFLKIAASLLILVSLVWFGISTINKDKNKLAQSNHRNPDSIVNQKVDSINKYKTNNNKKPKHYKKNEQYAQAYKSLPMFENFINNPLRSANLKVISPAINEKINARETINFRWQSNSYDSLNLVVFSNTFEIISENMIDTNYMLIKKLNPGLYYWQLENSSEAIFTGKIIVINTK